MTPDRSGENRNVKPVAFEYYKQNWLVPFVEVFKPVGIHEAIYDEFKTNTIKGFVDEQLKTDIPGVCIYEDSKLTTEENIVRITIEESITKRIGNSLEYFMVNSNIYLYSGSINLNSGILEVNQHDIFNIESRRRNPIIADLFNRLRFMERRGSGLSRIVEETKKLVGFSEQYTPEFESSQTEFRIVLKNVNYSSVQDSVQDSAQDSNTEQLLEFCLTARSRNEIQEFCGIKSREYFRKKY